jgi:prepilin-type N-terminal cleavage/methylation domain-containing protein
VKAGRQQGFTLLELLTVMAIMALVMGMTMASFRGLGRGARLRGAVNTVRSSLSMARQQAVMKGQTVELRFFETDGIYGYRVWNVVEDYELGERIHMPRGIRLLPADTVIRLLPSGGASAGDDPHTLLTLEETGRAAAIEIKVFHATGLVSIHDML